MLAEYPIKSAREGLAGDADWQNHHRKFDNCSFSLPHQTDPVGASACMTPTREQNSQGGTVSTFYQDWHMMNDDPFWVDLLP